VQPYKDHKVLQGFFKGSSRVLHFFPFDFLIFYNIFSDKTPIQQFYRVLQGFFKGSSRVLHFFPFNFLIFYKIFSDKTPIQKFYRVLQGFFKGSSRVLHFFPFKFPKHLIKFDNSWINCNDILK